MAFDDREISNYEGDPILLYEFHRSSGGAEFYWRYTSSESDVVYSGETFIATAISDSGVRQTGETASSDLTVTMPVVDELPAMFRNAGSSPSDTVFLTIRRIHADDAEARVVWVGTLAGMTQPDEVQVKITCSTLVASFKRGGLRLSWTRGCPHALYDPQCKVNPNDFDMVVVVVSHTGNSITAVDIGTQADGWWSGGYVEWSLPSGIVERRAITVHEGDTITVMGSFFGVDDGDSVTVFPGCLRTTADCNSKFGNLSNYGGFPHIPGKSPFSGDPVF